MEQNYVERLARIEERQSINTKSIEEHENRISELEKTYAIMQKIDYRVGNVEKTMENMNTKLDEVSNKEDKEKSKKWSKLIDYIFYSVLGVMLAIVIAKLNLK